MSTEGLPPTFPGSPPGPPPPPKPGLWWLPSLMLPCLLLLAVIDYTAWSMWWI